MKKVLLIGSILVLSLLSSISKSKEPLNQLPSKKEKEPTMLDRWNEVRRQAALATGAIRVPPTPRHVQRSAKPEIIIKGANIFFEGTLLELDHPLESWKKLSREILVATKQEKIGVYGKNWDYKCIQAGKIKLTLALLLLR